MWNVTSIIKLQKTGLPLCQQTGSCCLCWGRLPYWGTPHDKELSCLLSTASKELRSSVQQLFRSRILPAMNEWTWKQILPSWPLRWLYTADTFLVACERPWSRWAIAGVLTHRNCVILNVFCFKLQCLWVICYAAIDNEYRCEMRDWGRNEYVFLRTKMSNITF